MDTKPIFHLSAAVESWRSRLPALPIDDLAELESHLLDSMAELEQTGLSEDEAFLIASRRLGNPVELAAEFHEGESRAAVGVSKEMEKSPGHRWSRWLMALGTMGIGAAMVAMVGLVLTPKKYTATPALIQISPRPDLTVGGAGASLETTFRSPQDEERMAAMESGHISSGATLEKVVTALDLSRRWKLDDRAATLKKLRVMIETSWDPEVRCIGVAVTSTDKKEAVELANRVAEAYVSRSNAIEQERYAQAHAFMTTARQQQEATVETARNSMLQWVQDLGIVDWQPPGPIEGGAGGATAVEGGVPSTKAGETPPSPEMRAYEMAKLTYEQAQHNLRVLIEQQERTRVTHLPGRPAIIIQQATEPLSHSSPSTALWLSWAAISGLLGAVLVGFGRALRR